MLEAQNLECVKGYDSLFSKLSFTLNAGDVVRIGGTNGSGKTSLLRILTGLSYPETGEVLWQGQNIEGDIAFKENLLYIGHKNGLKGDLSALENLSLVRRYSNNNNESSTESALEAVGLRGYEHILAHQLSAGQKRRVSLARLLLSTAPLWILDEPTTAIDTDGVALFERCIEQHTRHQGMVVYTSHQDLHFGAAHCHTIAL